MEKISLFSIIFSLFFIPENAKANLQDSFKKKDSLNQTNCSWNSSQFRVDDLSYKRSFETYGYETRRYCVDYSKNTIFSVYKRDYGFDLERNAGFLNSGEAEKSVYGYFLYQYNIEGNRLVEYSCITSGPSSNSCLDNNRISKRVVGIKR